jgi:small subunit ribosomal protein S16
MSVTIRLARIGRKNLPSFRIVVSNTKDKRNGRFLEILGHFNPSGSKVLFDYDKERFAYWKKNGALVSKSAQDLVDGKYVFAPYKKKAQETKERVEKKEEAVEETK